MRIGIDVGGTNTDAVLMDGTTLVAKTKTATTPDVTRGIVGAIEQLLKRSSVSRDAVQGVMIGTTHFTNAIVERRRLSRTGILRVGLPATRAVEPFEDWPSGLLEAIGAETRLVHGGNEYDGREIAPLDPDEITQAARDFSAAGIESVAVSAVFSPITADVERRVALLIERAAPALTVTLSHEIGRLGLLERENAAAINASLRALASATISSFRNSLAELGISSPLYLTQNDGTLMQAQVAELYPVLTFASGPTNSMRGAAFLSGKQDALVLDVGGTTSDVGALANGFPRESSVAARFADVRTNFRMPDLISFGLGGGSRVRGEDPTIGPDSVGYAITERAVVFGGDTLTATDIAVAAGLSELGDPRRVAGLDRALVDRALSTMQARIEDALDRIKLSRGPEPLIVVGGGSLLVPNELAGTGEVLRPEHYEVANAVGAAIAQVSGEVDTIKPLQQGRDRILERAREQAFERAVANGAARDSVHIVEAEDLPVAYMEDSMLRVRIKAVGDLAAMPSAQQA